MSVGFPALSLSSLKDLLPHEGKDTHLQVGYGSANVEEHLHIAGKILNVVLVLK